MFDLHGRVAVVTGASSGLGVQMATGFAKQGADLVIMARRIERLQKIAEGILPCSRHPRSLNIFTPIQNGATEVI